MKKGGLRFWPAAAFAIIGIVSSGMHLYGQDFFAGDQIPRLNRISRADGLPHNAVSSIQQDQRGFLWFGTQGGLARYDGLNFKVYQNIPFDASSLPHDLVQTIYYEKKTDTLWAGTYNGLARFALGEPGFTTFRHNPDDPLSLSDDVVIAVGEGPSGDIWVGTQNGLNRLQDDGTFTRFPVDGNVVRAIFRDSSGTLWVGTLGGLLRWNEEARRFDRIDFGWSSPSVMAITEVEPGTLLLGTWGDDTHLGGAVLVDVENGTFREHHFADNRVYTVLSASDGTLWIGTWGGGLFAITPDGRQFDFSVSPDGLSSPVVYSLLEDRSGMVWVGTNGGGVHYLSPRRRNFRAFFHDSDNPASLPAGKINAIFRDRTGTLWVGLYGSGLVRYDEEGRRWIGYDHLPSDPYSLANDIVTDIYEDSRGRLWIGSNGGLQVYDQDTERFLRFGEHIYPESGYAGDVVSNITEDKDGNLWIGKYYSGVTRVNSETGETREYINEPGNPHSLSNNLVFDSLTDSNGDFWVGTNGGLNRYRPETDDFAVYRYDIDNPDGLTSNTVRVLFEDSQNRFWVGTVSGGLNSLDRRTGKFSHLTERDGLSDNTIVSILEGADGRLWLGTPRGLTVYDPDDSRLEIFDENDGLFGSEFQVGRFRDTDGTLLFGGGHGITRIDSSVARRNKQPPLVQITDVRVFQKSVNQNRQSYNGSEIELAPEDTFINIEFAGLDFESVESNQYAYQLVGFDRIRVETGSHNVATYTNLPSGRFEFRVWAANSDGVWAAAPATLKLRVRSPWYLRWWAYLGYGLMAALLVLGILRWRTARILEQKNQDLEYANNQLARANGELERLSIRDALTGLFNRRYFDSRLQEEWYRARRSGQPLALLMIDVDHFKKFNDTYGHVIGDKALSAAAAVFQQIVVRKTDFVARYGGEEFVVLLYDTADTGAAAISERIREEIAETPLVSGIEGVTVSVGYCVVVPDVGLGPESLLRCADTALYAAKRNGRNRVETGEVV